MRRNWHVYRNKSILDALGNPGSERRSYDYTYGAQGFLTGGGWGKVTDVSVTRKGDLPQRVVPRLAVANPVEAQAATPVEQTTFSHDANGNMTSDKSRGIVSMTYNVLSLPERAVFSDGSETRWVYTSSGEKLRESHVSPDGLSDRVTQYAGGMVLPGDGGDAGVEVGDSLVATEPL